MPRRKILTPAQTDALFGWPASKAELMRHCTLTREDLEVVATRRGDPSRPGFALQLCAARVTQVARLTLGRGDPG